MILERNIESILGCGKISRQFLNRITSRFVIGIDGKQYQGASSFEQAALIYFKQVCDKKNQVKEYKVQELEKILGCSRREVPILIDNLVKKGFITARYSEKNWTGIKDIRINDRNFCGVSDFRGTNRYLSAYYSIFNHNSGEYEKYRNLSLYAKRLLLILLYNYSDRYGYRVSYDELKSRLGIRNRGLIESYLQELIPILGKDFYKREPDLNKKHYYGMLIIYSNNFLFRQGLENSHDTFYKRKIRCFLTDSIIRFKETDMSSFVNGLFAVIYQYLLKGLELYVIEEVYRDWILAYSENVSMDLLRWIGVSLENKLCIPPT